VADFGNEANFGAGEWGRRGCGRGLEGGGAGFRNEANFGVGAALGLDADQVVQSAVEAAVGAFLAGVEAVELVRIAEEGFGGIGGAPVEIRFEAAQAAELPLGIGERVDEMALGRVGGPVGVAEGLDEGGVGLRIFAGEDFELGVDAGFKGVPAGGGFALGGARAGRSLRVAAIGLDLFVGCHADSRVAGGRVGPGGAGGGK